MALNPNPGSAGQSTPLTVSEARVGGSGAEQKRKDVIEAASRRRNARYKNSLKLSFCPHPYCPSPQHRSQRPNRRQRLKHLLGNNKMRCRNNLTKKWSSSWFKWLGTRPLVKYTKSAVTCSRYAGQTQGRHNFVNDVTKALSAFTFTRHPPHFRAQKRPPD